MVHIRDWLELSVLMLSVSVNRATTFRLYHSLPHPILSRPMLKRETTVHAVGQTFWRLGQPKVLHGGVQHPQEKKRIRF